MMTNNHSIKLTRRSALRASVLAATALFAARSATPARADDEDDPPFDPGGRVRVQYDETASFNELLGNPPMLGRSESWRLKVLAEPDDRSDLVRRVNYDDVLPIYAAIHGVAPGALEHNDIWYDLGDGFIHSSYVVPVKEVFHEPEETIGSGFWGEITVPTSWQHWEPKLRSKRYYDLAYGTTYWVAERADEPDGRAWYRIIDDLVPSATWWVQAHHVRKINRGEFRPISPDVDPADKRIEISIRGQLLTCFEGDLPVFSTRIASGASFFDDQGTMFPFGTPYGKHVVERKTPSRHMAGGEIINDAYDLPGVPWCTYFTEGGAAIHGTYWHNDFGRPRSHGCVNVTNDAACWIYRWVIPFTGYDVDVNWTTEAQRETATRIIVDS
jgi:hypothetical protein